ncbi:MAG: glycosyltransferase [Candidatus Obscuribacterales bacterium]|nr:glycosyltransferase [Candidatus Obscuribacterales bacterium]
MTGCHMTAGESVRIVRLSVIIVSWNVAGLLRRCLETLKEDLRGIDAEVFVVDNDSADQSVAMVSSEHPWVRLIANDSNRGFAAANNQALAQSSGEFVLLLNPDTEVRPGAIPTLLHFLEEHERAAVVAPQLINTDGSVQRSCRAFPTFAGMLFELLGLSKLFPNNEKFGHYKMLDFDHLHEREVDQPEGACLMMRRSVIDQVGTLDEGFFMLFEEVDWCYRIKEAGWQIWFAPQAQVVHHYGQSIKQVKAKMILSSHRGLYRFWSKHYCGNRTYLSGPVYLGLMLLAYFRIFTHSLRRATGGMGIVTLVACSLFPLFLALWFAFDHSWPFWDAADHVRVEFRYAEMLRHLKLFSWPWWHEFLTINYCYPQTVHIFDGVIKALLGPARWVDSLTLVCFSLILSFSVFGLGKILLKDHKAAILSVVLINCYPLVASLSHLKLLDFPHLALFCLGLLSLIFWREKPTWKRALLCGAGLGIACTSKQGASFFLVGPSLWFLYEKLRQKRMNEALQLVCAGAIVVLFLAVWFVFNWGDIHAYMSRNSGLIGQRTMSTAFVPNFLGYVLPFPALLGWPLMILFAVSLVSAKKDIWLKLAPVVVTFVVGLLCMSALPFQLPECRYIVPCMLLPAMLSAWQISSFINNKQAILKTLSLLLLSGGILQFFVMNYCPYPIPAPQWLTHSLIGAQGEKRGALEPSYNPTPAGDPYAQEWIVEQCTKAAGNRVCWLNMLPSTPELSVHTLEIVARYQDSNLRPTTVRLWTPVGDRIDFNQQALANFDFFMFKSGAQGLHFDGDQSTANYEHIEKWVKEGGAYELLAQRKIADGSEITIYRKKV